jgi:hypothetical protein
MHHGIKLYYLFIQPGAIIHNDARCCVPRLHVQIQQEWRKKHISFSIAVERGPELVLLLDELFVCYIVMVQPCHESWRCFTVVLRHLL